MTVILFTSSYLNSSGDHGLGLQIQRDEAVETKQTDVCLPRWQQQHQSKFRQLQIFQANGELPGKFKLIQSEAEFGGRHYEGLP